MANTIGAYPRGAETGGRSGQTIGAYEFPLAQEQSNPIGALGGYSTWGHSIGAYNQFVYDPATESSGPTAILADDVESASEVTTATVTQVHAILANDVSSLSEVTTATVTELHALLANDVESASEVTTATLAEIHALLANDVESASEVTSATITAQLHNILANDVESASELTQPTISGIADHALLGDDVESAAEVTSATITQLHAILGTSVESISEVSAPLLDENEKALFAQSVEAQSEVGFVADFMDGSMSEEEWWTRRRYLYRRNTGWTRV